MIVEDYSPSISVESIGLTETFDRFQTNLEKIDELSEQVQILSSEISSKLTKKDLENAMISHLMVVNENYKLIQNQVKGLNKSDLVEFKNGIKNLNEVVDNLISQEIPKYKNKITGVELSVNSSIENFKNEVDLKIDDYYSTIEEFANILQLVDGRLNENDLKIEEYKEEISKVLNKKIREHNSLSKKLISDSNSYKKELDEELTSFKENINDTISYLKTEHDQYIDKVNEFENNVENLEEKFSTIINDHNVYLNQVEVFSDTVQNLEEKFTDVKTDVVINEQHLKKVENFILKNHNHIVELKKEVFSEISKISLEDINENIDRIEHKIKYIEEVYKNISNGENLLVNESLLTEPPGIDNEDPLTPLDKNFVTQKELQDHYRLFLNRVQQQLASIGGGGETRLKYLDDVVGIATNPSEYDGKFLKYDHTLRKFVFDDSSSITVSDTIPINPVQGDLWYDSTLGRTFIYYVDPDGSQWVDASPAGSLVGSGNYWISTNAGIHTLSNVGIGTTNPISKLEIQGGDVRVGVDTSNGVILTSPNGTKFRLVVDNSGALSTVIVP